MIDAETELKDHRAYVGRPHEYDLLGASQFRLLTSLGLRARHYLLDFGCGALRAGRLFIPYLDPGHYCGIEPNRWLVEEALANELGRDVVALKRPRFDDNVDFNTAVFDQSFDFIIAQSIFSHADRTQIEKALRNFRASLQPDGLIAATFIEGAVDFAGSGWSYPQSVNYHPDTIRQMAAGAGLVIARLPWFHPRQSWYLLARNPDRLPTGAMRRHLSGVILFATGFEHSWRPLSRLLASLKFRAKFALPRPLLAFLRRARRGSA